MCGRGATQGKDRLREDQHREWVGGRHSLHTLVCFCCPVSKFIWVPGNLWNLHSACHDLLNRCLRGYWENESQLGGQLLRVRFLLDGHLASVLYLTQSGVQISTEFRHAKMTEFVTGKGGN